METSITSKLIPTALANEGLDEEHCPLLMTVKEEPTECQTSTIGSCDADCHNQEKMEQFGPTEMNCQRSPDTTSSVILNDGIDHDDSAMLVRVKDESGRLMYELSTNTCDSTDQCHTREPEIKQEGSVDSSIDQDGDNDDTTNKCDDKGYINNYIGGTAIPSNDHQTEAIVIVPIASVPAEHSSSLQADVRHTGSHDVTHTISDNREKDQESLTSANLCEKILKPPSEIFTEANKAGTSSSLAARHILVDTEEELCVCFNCGKSFMQACEPNQQASTRNVERSSACPKCWRGFGLSRPKKQRACTTDTPHVCPDCGKACSSTVTLKEHVLTHTRENPYICAHCGKGFIRAATLKRHTWTHTGVKPHICPQCGKSFGRSVCLQNHMLIHTGETPYVCPECGKGFRLTETLRRHTFIHTGGKPHVCPECGKGFIQAGQLKSHKLKHKQKKPQMPIKEQRLTHTREHPYMCSQCEKSFLRSATLKRHMWTHTGEKPNMCPQCGKSFKSSSCLQKHIHIHTGETPYVCPECGKGFRRNETLRRHKFIHTGEKPHVCPECGKGFIQPGQLKSHKLKHKQNKPQKRRKLGKDRQTRVECSI